MSTVEPHIPGGFEEYQWAIDIVRTIFTRGLIEICEPDFVAKRYSKFLDEQDPLLFPIMMGLDERSDGDHSPDHFMFQEFQRRRLSDTFISYSKLSDTLATRCRFWLEDAIYEILLRRPEQFGPNVTHLLTGRMLAEYLPESNRMVADLGVDQVQHIRGKKSWEVELDEDALDTVDERMSIYDKQYVNKPLDKLSSDNIDRFVSEVEQSDLRDLHIIAESFKGRATKRSTIACDLLVIAPDRLDGRAHAQAFRFINTKTFRRPGDRRKARQNLLYLYAFLVQQKVERLANSLKVYVAEIAPRRANHRYTIGFPYFTSHTYLDAEQLWDYIGVPFHVVEWTLRDIGQRFLSDRLRELLPGRERSR
jgi:hypothetical protein